MMSLQELKQDIKGLGCIDSNIKDFKENWLKPLRKGQKGHKVQQELHNLEDEQKKAIHSSLKHFYGKFDALQDHSMINDQLQFLSSALVDMKIMALQGAENSSKMKFLQSKVMQDQNSGISSTIENIKNFSESLNEIEALYHDINGYLHQTLSLEHSVALMELPHYAYLKNLQQTAQEHKRIVQHLGREFVSMQRILQSQKKMQKRSSV